MYVQRIVHCCIHVWGVLRVWVFFHFSIFYFFMNNFHPKCVLCWCSGQCVVGRGWEIVAPVNGVGSLTLMSDTNHTFFEIFVFFIYIHTLMLYFLSIPLMISIDDNHQLSFVLIFFQSFFRSFMLMSHTESVIEVLLHRRTPSVCYLATLVVI